jgi:hypothetical protein
VVVEFTNEELLNIAAALFGATYLFERRTCSFDLEEDAVMLISEWRSLLLKIERELGIPIEKMARGRLWS